MDIYLAHRASNTSAHFSPALSFALHSWKDSTLKSAFVLKSFSISLWTALYITALQTAYGLVWCHSPTRDCTQSWLFESNEGTSILHMRIKNSIMDSNGHKIDVAGVEQPIVSPKDVNYANSLLSASAIEVGLWESTTWYVLRPDNHGDQAHAKEILDYQVIHDDAFFQYSMSKPVFSWSLNASQILKMIK